MSESIDVTTAPQGQTALWVAAHEGHREIVELLIEHNADVHVPDNAGSTPLWAAAQVCLQLPIRIRALFFRKGKMRLLDCC